MPLSSIAWKQISSFDFSPLPKCIRCGLQTGSTSSLLTFKSFDCCILLTVNVITFRWNPFPLPFFIYGRLTTSPLIFHTLSGLRLQKPPTPPRSAPGDFHRSALGRLVWLFGDSPSLNHWRLRCPSLITNLHQHIQERSGQRTCRVFPCFPRPPKYVLCTETVCTLRKSKVAIRGVRVHSEVGWVNF